MDRLFLDANILFSAAYSPDSVLHRFWKLSNVILCSSRYAVEEVKNNLLTDGQLERLQTLVAKLEMVDADYSVRSSTGEVLLPEKDRPILMAAIAARASHLITGDIRHFGPLFGKPVRGVVILLPAKYLKLASSR